MIGQWIAPVFSPLGFGDWRVATSLISGFVAKEAVVSTLSVLTGTGIAQLHLVLSNLFTPLSAASFLVFTLLYTPCVAAVATMKKGASFSLGDDWRSSHAVPCGLGGGVCRLSDRESFAMSVWDYLVLAAVVLVVFFAIRSIVKRRKKGGCAGCSGNCSACSLHPLEKQGEVCEKKPEDVNK